MKTILIIGSGGREHALGWKLKQSPQVSKIYFVPGNAGTRNIGENVDIGVEEIEKLVKFAKKNEIDLTVVGPEAPLVLGITDRFHKENLAIIGPSQKASRIESSKIFAKKLMSKYHIPTAEFAVFDNYKKAHKYLETASYPLVIKADGLCTGKGVGVFSGKKEAILFLKQLMVEKIFGNAGEKIIVEECLFGQEVSFMVLTDGKHFVSFLPSQDHKRLLDHDRGPNTGGMGAYAPVPVAGQKLIAEIEKKIVAPTISAMSKENSLYQGILYPGLILTKEGPKVLEFNCRFGDPETQPLMALLKTDLFQALMSIVENKVHKQKLSFKNGYSVCVVIASGGYPGHYKKGEVVYGLDKINDKNIQVFHAGTAVQNHEVVTNGGRVLGVTAWGKDIRTAIQKAYSIIGKKDVYFKGMQYRKDIGKKAII